MFRLGAKFGVFVGHWDFNQAKLYYRTAATPAAERNVKYAVDALAADPAHKIASHTLSRALPHVLFYETAAIVKATGLLDRMKVVLAGMRNRHGFSRIAPPFFVGLLALVSLSTTQCMKVG